MVIIVEIPWMSTEFINLISRKGAARGLTSNYASRHQQCVDGRHVYLSTQLHRVTFNIIHPPPAESQIYNINSHSLRHAEIGTSWVRNNPIQVVRYARIKSRRIPAALSSIADNTHQEQATVCWYVHRTCCSTCTLDSIVSPHQSSSRVHLAGILADSWVRAEDGLRYVDSV